MWKYSQSSFLCPLISVLLCHFFHVLSCSISFREDLKSSCYVDFYSFQGYIITGFFILEMIGCKGIVTFFLRFMKNCNVTKMYVEYKGPRYWGHCRQDVFKIDPSQDNCSPKSLQAMLTYWDEDGILRLIILVGSGFQNKKLSL